MVVGFFCQKLRNQGSQIRNQGYTISLLGNSFLNALKLNNLYGNDRMYNQHQPCILLQEVEKKGKISCLEANDLFLMSH